MSQMSDLHISAVRREQAQLAELRRKNDEYKARHGHSSYVFARAIEQTKASLLALSQQAKGQN